VLSPCPVWLTVIVELDEVVSKGFVRATVVDVGHVPEPHPAVNENTSAPGEI
jgi:hypothetical protein